MSRFIKRPDMTDAQIARAREPLKATSMRHETRDGTSGYNFQIDYAGPLSRILDSWVQDLDRNDEALWSQLMDCRDGTVLATFRDDAITLNF